jgi:hypothetical protein
MRKFNDKEKEILGIINNLNGEFFERLIADKISNVKITINIPQQTIDIRYKSISFTPAFNLMPLIENISNQLFERMFLSANLLKFFEKEGMISFYQRNSPRDIVVLGDKEIENEGILNSIEDELTKKVIFEYINKIIIVTSEFQEFVENDFTARDERMQISNNKAAWTAVISTLLFSIISLVLSIISLNNNDITNFNTDFNKKTIELQIIPIKIDSLIIKSASTNKKLDSIININYAMKQQLKEANKKINQLRFHK